MVTRLKGILKMQKLENDDPCCQIFGQNEKRGKGGPIQHFNQGVGHMVKESIQQLLTLSVRNELG